jgi:hypothetical protein
MLSFGIEQEHFFFASNGGVPERSQLRAFIDAVKHTASSQSLRSNSLDLLAIDLITPLGPVRVKTDFCTHIIEVVFPPLRELNAFELLYENVFDAIHRAAEQTDLEVRLGGSLDSLPADTILEVGESDQDGKRLRALLGRKMPKTTYAVPMFQAGICATQVHLNILDDSFYDMLPLLYAYEYLIPLLFSNSKSFLGQSAHCVRPLVYRDNFDNDYLAHAYPVKIPTTRGDYESLLTNSQPFIRDYSFICPSKHGTVEFRTGCSQNTSIAVCELIALRIAIYLAAQQRIAVHAYDRRRETFYNVCEKRNVESQIIDQDSYLIKRCIGTLPRRMQECASDVWKRL